MMQNTHFVDPSESGAATISRHSRSASTGSSGHFMSHHHHQHGTYPGHQRNNRPPRQTTYHQHAAHYPYDHDAPYFPDGYDSAPAGAYYVCDKTTQTETAVWATDSRTLPISTDRALQSAEAPAALSLQDFPSQHHWHRRRSDSVESARHAYPSYPSTPAGGTPRPSSSFCPPPPHYAYPVPSNTNKRPYYSAQFRASGDSPTHTAPVFAPPSRPADRNLVTPTPKKMKLAPSFQAEEYSRKSKSLGLLCENFCKQSWHNQIIQIDEAAKLMGVERRRIYDIINILEALYVVKRECKNRYKWCGFNRLPEVLAEIQSQGFQIMPQEAKEAGLLKSTEEIPEGTQQAEPKARSLGRLCRQFLQLFLVGQKVVSLTGASDRILGKADDIVDEDGGALTRGQKTKIRRLYDIANVMASIGLVQKVEGRRPTFRWMYQWTPLQIRTFRKACSTSALSSASFASAPSLASLSPPSSLPGPGTVPNPRLHSSCSSNDSQTDPYSHTLEDVPSPGDQHVLARIHECGACEEQNEARE